MDHVLNTDELAWKAFTADSLKGYELKPGVIGAEYTDAYSVDLVRVAPGGFSASHVDKARHAFFILSGHGRITVGAEVFWVSTGDIVKIPPGIAHAVNNDDSSDFVFLTMYDPPRKREGL
jgi:quercetin dioxygenase-like cupin family protein